MENNTVRFHVTAERVEEIEFGMLLDVSGDSINYPAAAQFLAFFAADENGEYLGPEAAMAAVRRLRMRDLQATTERLVAEMGEAAVPNG